MVGDSDDSLSYAAPALRQPVPKMNWWRHLLIFTNLVFTIFYISLTIWLSTIIWLYAVLFPFYFLLFRLNYSNKVSNIDKLHRRGELPKFELGANLVSMCGNILLLLLMLVITAIDAEFPFSIFFAYPVFMITTIDLENLGSFIAYNQAIKKVVNPELANY